MTCDVQGLSSNFVAYMRLTITFTLGMTRLHHSCACGCSVILLLLAGYFLSDTVIMLTNRSRINVARHCRKNCALRLFLLDDFFCYESRLRNQNRLTSNKSRCDPPPPPRRKLFVPTSVVHHFIIGPCM